jgi:hypothetical protein
MYFWGTSACTHTHAEFASCVGVDAVLPERSDAKLSHDWLF